MRLSLFLSVFLAHLSSTADASSWVFVTKDTNTGESIYIDKESITTDGATKRAAILGNCDFQRTDEVSDGRQVTYSSWLASAVFDCSQGAVGGEATYFSGKSMSGQITAVEKSPLSKVLLVDTLPFKILEFVCGPQPKEGMFGKKTCIKMPGTWHPGHPGWFEEGQEVCY